MIGLAGFWSTAYFIYRIIYPRKIKNDIGNNPYSRFDYMNEYHLITNDKKGKKDVKSEINDLNQIIINYQKKNQEAAMMAQKLDHIISGHNLPKY